MRIVGAAHKAIVNRLDGFQEPSALNCEWCYSLTSRPTSVVKGELLRAPPFKQTPTHHDTEDHYRYASDKKNDLEPSVRKAQKGQHRYYRTGENDEGIQSHSL